MATALGYNATTIIEEVLRKLGVLGEGASASTNQKNDALKALNFITKSFDADVYNRWFIKSASTTEAYTAGTNNNDLATDVLWIEEAVWETTATTTTVQLTELKHGEYARITNKSTQATPEYYFLSTDLSTPKLYVYPTPTANGSVYYWYRRKVDIFDNTSDTPDIPDEWLYWLVLQLTADMADHYAKPLEIRDYWQKRADKEWAKVMRREPKDPREAETES